MTVGVKQLGFETVMGTDRAKVAAKTRYQAITLEQAGKLKVALKDMSCRPKGLELKDVVQQNRRSIEAALRQGWLFEDIQQTFAQQGISISVRTLKRYLAAPGNGAEGDSDGDNDSLAGDSDVPDLGTGSSPA